MRIDNDNVIFSTGKIKYANRGIIGLSPCLEIWEGYDGSFDELTIDEQELTIDEQVELAEYMINAWQRFKDAAEESKNRCIPK